MPILYNEKLPDGSQLALWQICEDEDFFQYNLKQHNVNLKPVEKFKARHRRLEWLAVRWLLQVVLNRTVEIEYDKHGRPILKNANVHISISHSRTMAGIYLMHDKPPGLDIELISSKVEKVKHKFMSAKELGQLSLENYKHELLMYWCAKECLLKIYGQKNIDFIEHLKISPFPYSNKGSFRASIEINDFHSEHTLHFLHFGNYVVVYGH